VNCGAPRRPAEQLDEEASVVPVSLPLQLVAYETFLATELPPGGAQGQYHDHHRGP